MAEEEIPNGFPKFDMQPNMQGVEKGRNALIPCKVNGEPEPIVTWLKDMVPIDMTKPRYSIYQGSMLLFYASYFPFNSLCFLITVTASLQIISAQEEDQGQYECAAENDKGTAYSELATLHVRSIFAIHSIIITF